MRRISLYAVVAAAVLAGASWSGTAPAYSLRDLGSLGAGQISPNAVNDQGQAVSINDQGEVLGFSSSRKRGLRGVIWSGRRARSLGSPRIDGEPQSVFSGRLNNRDEVVGTLFSQATGARAFYWSRGRLVDLEGLLGRQTGWELGSARGVNDQGQIAGLGNDPEGADAGFLLTPVGE